MKRKTKKKFKFKSAARKPIVPTAMGPNDPMYPHFNAEDIPGNIGDSIELMLRGKIVNKREDLNGCDLGIEVHEIGSEGSKGKRSESNYADVELDRLQGAGKIEVDVRNSADRALDKLSNG